MNTSKRLFAAIKINPGQDFRSWVSGIQTSLLREKIKWVEPWNLHITLRFFGETPVSQIPGIIAVYHEIRAGIQPFRLSFNKLGLFGSRYNPRVIWVGGETPEAMHQLIMRQNETLTRIGFPETSENFVTHLTLGRVKLIENKQLLQTILDQNRELFFEAGQIDRFFLYESILKKEGPQYKVLETFILGTP